MNQLREPIAKQDVAKSKKTEDAPKSRQVNFSAPPKLAGDLEDIATAFGLDVANLVRMILNQNIAKYKKQADRIRQGLPAEEPDGAESS